jgi:hypothetical protein
MCALVSAQTGTVVSDAQIPVAAHKQVCAPSVGEFKNARPVIVDQAGYREMVEQTIGLPPLAPDARVVEQQWREVGHAPAPGQVGAEPPGIAFTSWWV